MKEGEKLLLLVRRDPRSSEAIAEAMGVDKSYLPRLYKLDKLPPKPFQKALKVFGVSATYFQESEPLSLVEDPAASNYQPDTLRARLEAEIAELKAEITRLNKMLEQEKGINAALSEAILNMSKR